MHMQVKYSAKELAHLPDGWKGVVYTDWDFPPDVIEAWDQLARSYGDKSIFINYEWFDSWWKAFGKGKNPFVTVLQKDGKIKAIFPLCTDDQLENRLTSMTNDHTCHYDFIVEPQARTDAISVFLKLFKYIAPNNTIEIDYIPIDSDNMLSLVLKLRSNWMPVHAESHPQAPWTKVTGNWEQYCRSLPKGLKDTIKYGNKKAEAKGRLRFEAICHTDSLDKLLNTFFDVEYNSWKGQEGTAIKCQTDVERFYRLFADKAMQRGELILQILTLEEIPVAADYCLRSGETVYLVKTGYNEAFASLSPGVLLRFHSLKYLFEQPEISTYSFLGVCDPWKMRWTSLSEEYGHIKIYPKSLRGWNRYSIEHGWKDLLKRSSMIRRAKNWLDGRRELRNVP